MANSTTYTLGPTPTLRAIKQVRVERDGVTIVLKKGQPIKLNSDEVSNVWALLTLGLDAASDGALANSLKNRGFHSTVLTAMQGVKEVVEEVHKNQLALDLEKKKR